ncbi:MAG TPA: VOC family protein [Micavibrio sp.]|nr:VOC family protein [Micavibrio sp.]
MSQSFLKSNPVDEKVRIGHVHLKVANIERALGFYCDVLGFHITQRYGDSAVFISAGDYHHHIGLNTWESKGGPPPPPGSTGLYHTAILYPTRAALADAIRRVKAAGIELDGAADHGVSEAVYLRDPDNNGVELYWDKARELWPVDAGGLLKMYTKRLDLDNLLSEAPPHKISQHMRLQALSRWENEGGSLNEPDEASPNPEERSICNEYRQPD